MVLEGIRVIDWTLWQQGPVATAMLGDLGAEVLKVEDPQIADPARGLRKTLGVPLDLPGGRNVIFEHHNRNKKGIAVNLKSAKGREIMYRLVAKSDVFVHNWRVSVPSRLGLDYDTLKGVNPRLIYASASGYGPKGPEREAPSLDAIGYARSGIMWNVGEPTPYPQTLAPGFADQMGAIVLSYGVIAALLARERLGIGQEISVSHLGSMIAFQSPNIFTSLLTGHRFERHSRRKPSNPLYNYYQCKDGLWLFIALVQSERFWPDFCRSLQLQDLKDDPRFSGADAREANSEELVTILDRVFATKTYDEWRETLNHISQDFIYTLVQDYHDLARDQQVTENSYLVDFEHVTLGTIKMPGFPVSFEKTPSIMVRPAPEHGEHTEEVLVGVCGYSWDEVIRLKEDGAIP